MFLRNFNKCTLVGDSRCITGILSMWHQLQISESDPLLDFRWVKLPLS
jgi:hypothetical protein